VRMSACTTTVTGQRTLKVDTATRSGDDYLRRPPAGTSSRPRTMPVVNSVVLADMLTYVMEAATLVREAREESGLSLRALAELSDVSYTTICRIEQGHIDPTTGTLRKLLGALGEELELGRRPAPGGPQLADLTDVWSTDRFRQDQPDWTRLRAFLDYLARHPDMAMAAIRSRPATSKSLFLDNLIAGIAEKIADDAGATRPAWTKRVPKLTDTWESLGTPRMRASAAAATPPQLAARHIVIPEASLWRRAS
jgi:transcriptional regulator with XRE-family HTH domain